MTVIRRVLLLVLALALLLAACGTNDDAAPGDEGGGAAAEGEGEGEATGELTVWAMGNEGERLSVLADAFMEENPDITLTVTPIAWDVAHERLLTSVAGQELPDVSQMGTTWMGEFAEIGALAPVPESIDPDAFFESAFETNVVEDTAYGVPWYVETRLLYYRTDLAEEAGIDGPPETWEDLRAMAEAYKEAGAENGISLSQNNWQELVPFIWSNGGQLVNEEGEFTLDSPEVVEALEFYDSFWEDGLTSAQPEGFDITNGFIQGIYPMFFSGPWHLALIEETGGEEFADSWAVAPLPANDSATSFIGGSNLVVFEDSPNQELAWRFVEFISRPDVQVQWYEEVGVLPSVQEAWEADELASDEQLATFGQQLTDTQAPPAIPTWEQVAEAINTQMEEVTVGDASAEEAAQALQAEAESIGSGG